MHQHLNARLLTGIKLTVGEASKPQNASNVKEARQHFLLSNKI